MVSRPPTKLALRMMTTSWALRPTARRREDSSIPSRRSLWLGLATRFRPRRCEWSQTRRTLMSRGMRCRPQLLSTPSGSDRQVITGSTRSLWTEEDEDCMDIEITSGQKSRPPRCPPPTEHKTLPKTQAPRPRKWQLRPWDSAATPQWPSKTMLELEKSSRNEISLKIWLIILWIKFWWANSCRGHGSGYLPHQPKDSAAATPPDVLSLRLGELGPQGRNQNVSWGTMSNDRFGKRECVQ